MSVTSQGKSSEVEKVVLLYLTSLASHKIFYILNWMYRYQTEGYYDIFAVVAGLVQAGIYVNFFVMQESYNDSLGQAGREGIYLV